MKKQIFGAVVVETAPVDFQEERARARLGIPPHIWERYPIELKGKTLAAEELANMESILIRRQEIIENNRKTRNKGSVATNEG